MTPTPADDRLHPTEELTNKSARLERLLDSYGNALIAYSGGVDSAYLLYIAVQRLGEKALAVTADSPSIPREELQQAIALAAQIGARHEIIATDEMSDPAYVANGPDRCYHCKKTLFSRLTEFARDNGFSAILEGSNVSDLSDYRPGARAVEEFSVLSPLREAELTKQDIRDLSKRAGLSTWDKPAAPCLSSRIPYGLEVSREKLSRIERAEAFLRSLGLVEFRVRDHGDVARIEAAKTDLPRLVDPDLSERIYTELKKLGYKYIAVDLLGFRSGSLNESLKVKSNEQG